MAKLKFETENGMTCKFQKGKWKCEENFAIGRDKKSFKTTSIFLDKVSPLSLTYLTKKGEIALHTQGIKDNIKCRGREKRVSCSVGVGK